MLALLGIGGSLVAWCAGATTVLVAARTALEVYQAYHAQAKKRRDG